MEYVSPDPKAQVRALNVRATLDAFDLIPAVGQRIVRSHHLELENLKPDHFIQVQSWLDALKEINAKIGSALVQQVGAKIIENADFPPKFNSVESVLLALDDIYYLNHRGNVGHYVPKKEADGSITVRCETPYPRDFERGLIEGISRNTRLTNGKRYQVKYTPGLPGGDLTCTVVVRQY
jgi:hypothetical protein